MNTFSKQTEIDLNECKQFLKVNWDRPERVWTLSQSKLRSINFIVWMASNSNRYFYITLRTMFEAFVGDEKKLYTDIGRHVWQYYILYQTNMSKNSHRRPSSCIFQLGLWQSRHPQENPYVYMIHFLHKLLSVNSNITLNIPNIYSPVLYRPPFNILELITRSQDRIKRRTSHEPNSM